MRRPKISSVLFLMAMAFVCCSHGWGEVLVYVLKGGTAKGSKINDGATTSWPGIPRNIDSYLTLDLDGVDSANPEESIDRLGKTFFPSQAVFDHKLEEKHLYGGSVAGIGYEVYGRSRDARGRRTFTWLHLQRDGRISEQTARDSGAGVGQGIATLLDIGTGQPGYYAKRLNFQIWRLDGGFSGTFSGFQDGRQTKYAAASLNLDLESTRSINQAGLGGAAALVWLVENV